MSSMTLTIDLRSFDQRVQGFSNVRRNGAASVSGSNMVEWFSSIDKRKLLASALVGVAAISSGGAVAGKISSTDTVYFPIAACESLDEAWFAHDLDIWSDVDGEDFGEIYAALGGLAEQAANALIEFPVTVENSEAWATALLESQRG